jgi:hypothetical protein
MTMGLTAPADTGINISNNSFINLDPSIAYNDNNNYGPNPAIKRALLIWETNLNGHFDIYGSFYRYVQGWSAPAGIVVSSTDKYRPQVVSLDTNQFAIVYDMAGDIYFKRYLSGAWLSDTNLTLTEPNVCSNAYITYDQISQSLIVSYDNLFSANKRIVNYRYKPNNGTWSSQDTIAFAGDNHNLGFTVGATCLFESNRRGNWNIHETVISGSSKMQFDVIFELNCSNTACVASGVPVITLNSPGMEMARSYVRKKPDSTQIVFDAPSNKYYIGDTTKTTAPAIGKGLYVSTTTVRFWVVFSKDTSSFSNLYGAYKTVTFGGIRTINSKIPDYYKLNQNYPNPFNPSTRIEFAVPKPSSVRLVLYDVLGREAMILVNENLNAGNYAYEFDAGDLSTGIYLYRLEAGDFVQSKRMVLLK